MLPGMGAAMNQADGNSALRDITGSCTSQHVQASFV